MKISLLCPYLSINALGRSFILAKVLSKRYEVEIIGPISSNGLWPPLRQERFKYHAVNIKPGWGNFTILNSILAKTTGHIIYASKPLLSSFGIGLLKKVKSKTPLVIDIDDWELGGYLDEHIFRRFKLLLKLNPQRLDGYYPFIWLMFKLIRYADAITVSSNFLNKKYGGVIIPRGRDTTVLNPVRFNAKSLKKQNGLEGKKVVMFLGTPHPRKDLEDLVKAVKFLDREDLILAIVGIKWKNPFTNKLTLLGRGHMKLFGMQQFSEIPRFLAMADVVVIPQRSTSFTMGQVPAKLFDAMAMAKPIVATAVSDIPEILDDNLVIVVEPNNVEQLANGINWVLENKNEAEEMGAKSRDKCIRKYSLDAIETTLFKVFEQFT